MSCPLIPFCPKLKEIDGVFGICLWDFEKCSVYKKLKGNPSYRLLKTFGDNHYNY